MGLIGSGCRLGSFVIKNRREFNLYLAEELLSNVISFESPNYICSPGNKCAKIFIVAITRGTRLRKQLLGRATVRDFNLPPLLHRYRSVQQRWYLPLLLLYGSIETRGNNAVPNRAY